MSQNESSHTPGRTSSLSRRGFVGGAVVTEAYAKQVGAAGSSRDALEAVALFKGIIKKQ